MYYLFYDDYKADHRKKKKLSEICHLTYFPYQKRLFPGITSHRRCFLCLAEETYERASVRKNLKSRLKSPLAIKLMFIAELT